MLWEHFLTGTVGMATLCWEKRSPGFAFLIVITIFARRGRAKFGPVKAVPVVETAASLDLSDDDRELLADELDDFSE